MKSKIESEASCLVREIDRKCKFGAWSWLVFSIALVLALAGCRLVRAAAGRFVSVKVEFACFILVVVTFSLAWYFICSIRSNMRRVKGIVLNLVDEKEQVVKDAMHDMKSTVVAINSWAVLLKSGQVKPADTKSAAEKIQVHCGRLVKRIDTNVEITNNYTAVERPPETLLNLTELVAEVVEGLKVEASGNNVRLECRFPEKDVEMMANDSKIDSLVQNLVMNAIKYNKPNGEVRVSLWREKDFVNLRVADTGIGIDEENIDRIFERHYRVDRTKGDGNGLGLPQVKSVAKLYGGSVSVDSTPGVGSTFTVTLPADTTRKPSRSPLGWLKITASKLMKARNSGDGASRRH